MAVNQELVLLYWRIGKEILQRQASEGWGSKVVDRLAQDLHSEFPDIKGLSRTNLLYMRAFAETWPDESIVQQVVGKLPWGHNIRLLDAAKDHEERLWYAHAAIQNGWSRNVLSDADRKWPLPAPGEGGHELPNDASQTTIRSCPTAHQGPV